MHANSAIGIIMLAAWGSAPALAQSGSPVRAGRFQGSSFVIAQLSSTGSVAFYGSRKIGRGMLVAGTVSNARTDYQAAIVGAGTRLRLTPGSAVTIVAAGALATDGPSARLYVLASVTGGRLEVASTATALQPLGGASRREAAITPLTVTVHATPVLAAGVAFVARLKERLGVHAGLGPTLQVRTALGRLSAEVIPVGLRVTEARFTFSASF